MLRFGAIFLAGLLLAGVFSEEKVKEKKAAVYPTEDVAADVHTTPVKFPGPAYPPGFYQHANAYYPPSGLLPSAYANAANTYYRGPAVRPGLGNRVPFANRPLVPPAAVNPYLGIPAPATGIPPLGNPLIPGSRLPTRYQGTIPPFVGDRPGVNLPIPGSPYYPGNPDYPAGYDPIYNYPDTIPGTPGVDYPVFSVIPPTAFKCDPNFPGFYADLDTACQVWHYCQLDGRQDSFLCPNGTIFNQKYFVCDWYYNVDCGQSASLYDLNSNLYQEGHGIHGFIGFRPPNAAPAYIPPLQVARETDALPYIRTKKDSPKPKDN